MPFTLSTIYKAIDKHTPILKKIGRANSEFAARQDRAFKQFGRTVTNVKNQLIALAGGVSIATLLFTGANAVVKYDEALNSLSAITGITGKNFDKYKQEVIDVSTRTKKAAFDTAKAFELIGSAQPELLKDAEALSKVTENAIILSKASKDTLEVSARSLTSVLNQFSLGAEHSARVINVLSAGSVVGAANITEVAEAMKNVGAVASSSNATVEQTVALIEVLGKFQLKGAEAGTKLRGVFLKLQKAGIGYRSGQFQINDAITEANERISKLTSAKAKDALMTKIFGAENITAGKIILSNQKLFHEYTKGVTGTTMAQKQAEINTASFSIKLQELRARFENLIIRGNESSNALNRLGKIIGFVTDNLDKILTVVGLTIAAFATYYTLMTTLRVATIAYNVVLGIFFAFQKAVPIALTKSAVAMKAYAVAQKIATAATWLFNTALFANPIVWIVVAIIAAIAAITILVIKWKEITEWWKKSSTAMKILLAPLLIANAALIAIAWIIRKVIDGWQGLKKSFQEGGFLKGIIAVGKLIFSLILKPIELILKAIGKIPGLGFAKRGGEMLAKFREGLEPEKMEKETKPVNVQKANNDVITSRFEEITREKLEIELNNRTDKKVNLKKLPEMIPVTTNTF